MDAIPITKKIIAFGTKKIYLPKFTVALLRTPKLSPYHARFLVPLNFSKYDLRDYLYHAYNVRCFNIRSSVKLMPVRDTPDKPRNWFRPESKKYMTVEMEQPFVWPKVPDLEPWGKEIRKQELETSAAAASAASNNKDQRDSAKKLRMQAMALLERRITSQDAAIRLKKREGVALSRDEKLQDRKWQEMKRRAKSGSTLQRWEDMRLDKVVQTDIRDVYKTKA
ncbi:mitochondrial 54S ribosomal protein YmL41 [Pleosporales sp. CAS-2024a]